MYKICYLINTEAGAPGSVFKQISEMPNWKEGDVVTGRYDLIMWFEANNLDDVGKLSATLRKLPDVKMALSNIALRV